MPTYGLSAAGWLSPTADEIVALVEADWQAAFGADFAVGLPPASDIIQTMAQRELSLWQAGEALWNSYWPDTASGVSLDLIGSAEGITRNAASSTAVTLTLTGTPTTIVPDGSIAANPTTGVRWVIDGPATIGGGGTVSATAYAEDTGPIPATAGTITQIVTSVAGWSSVTNPADHTTLGTDEETDAAYRIRIMAAVGGPRARTVDDVYQSVSEVAGVTAVRAFENTTDTTDDAGRPAHSFEVVVLGGTDSAVAQAVWDAKPAGVRSYGNDSASITDAAGNSQTVEFSRPTEVDVYVTVVVTTGGVGVWPVDGTDQVETAMLAYGDGLSIGDDVIAYDMGKAIDVPGVRRLAIYIGTSPSPASTDDLTIGATEIAAFDSTRVTVTVA